MPRPILIEFTVPDDNCIYLIFQSKRNPPLDQEFHDGEVWVNRCPDDGTLFLEGHPADYIEAKICLDAPNDSLSFVLSTEMVEKINEARTCSFGDTSEAQAGGSGPGFTCDGSSSFKHDGNLGVSNERRVVRKNLGHTKGIVVLIDRPGHHEWRKYYYEDDPPVPQSIAEGRRSLGDQADDDQDVEMDDSDFTLDETESFVDDLAAEMKTLRLKGK